MASALMMPRRTLSEISRSKPATLFMPATFGTGTGRGGALNDPSTPGDSSRLVPSGLLAMAQASDEKAEYDVQGAEPRAENQRMALRGHGEREASQGNEQRAHDAYEPHGAGDGHGARRQYRAAVE